MPDPSQTIDAHCPCGQVHQFAAEFVGRAAHCPNCNLHFHVPPASGPINSFIRDSKPAEPTSGAKSRGKKVARRISRALKASATAYKDHMAHAVSHGGWFGAPPIICPNPNCGYRGKPRRKARGSIIVGLFLCMFLLLPGILYFMLKSGYRIYCPRCGLQIAADY
jgi:hypothetical protein